MATTIKTVMIYNLNGSTTDFNIPFEYLARKYITVTLIGTDRKVLTLNQDYRFATKTTISTVKAWGPSDGYSTIEIRRYTSATERLVDFADGSILRAYDLNIAQVQTLHVAEEARDLTADTIGVNNDGNLDARGRRIVNVADAIDDYDAINLHQVKAWNDSALNSAERANSYQNQALGFRDYAWLYKEDALKSQLEASTLAGKALEYRDSSHAAKDESVKASNESADWASKSQGFRDEAWQYQDWAKGYKEASEISSKSASSSADRAKVEADKLGNMNAFAGAIESVSASGDVIFKGTASGKSLAVKDGSGRLPYYIDTNGPSLRVRADSSVISGTPVLSVECITTAPQLQTTDGVIRWLRGDRELNMTLNEGYMSFNRNGVNDLDFNGLNGLNLNTVKSSVLMASGALYCGNAIVSTDGNIQGDAWAGSLRTELSSKASWDVVNNKVDTSVAAGKFLVDVGHGAQTANPLNNHQGGFEVPSGHSLVGWFSTVSDGSIRYTNWISRCLMKRVESGGWVQCYNIM